MTTETKTIPVDLKREYTLEEYTLLEDDDQNYELLEGKLVMTPAPADEHGRICDELLTELKLFLRANKGIGAVWSHTGFNIGKKSNGKDNVPEPDLGFIIQSRVPPVSSGYLPYPDLAIEVWSRTSDLADPSRLKKAREKLLMYLEAGTQIAWGINPIAQEIEVYQHRQTQPIVILGLGDELDGGEIIPGFKMRVAALFGQAS